MRTSICLLYAAAALVMFATAASAQEGDRQPPNRPALSPLTVMELHEARQASAAFHDVDRAIEAGYADIGVFYANMGWHYLKNDALDEHFDPSEPELLVYADDPYGGKRRLVAVEYAIPLDKSAQAPSGFTGSADAWSVNSTFQLWTLHVWLWEHNPQGLFASHNPRLP